MSNGYLEVGDAKLQSWAMSFHKHLVAKAGGYGVSPEQIAAIGTRLAGFSAALAACEPSVRSVAATARKNTARRDLLGLVRPTARAVNARVDLSNDERITLGLKVRRLPTRVGALAERPIVQIESVSGCDVRVNLKHAAGWGKPASAIGATFFYFAGPNYPSSESGWHFAGNFTRTRLTLKIPVDASIGARVWIMARWLSPRLQFSPPSLPISTYLQAGFVDTPAKAA